MFKVVKNAYGLLYSAFVSDTLIAQRYSIGQFVYSREDFPFMVFEHYKDAIPFIQGMRHLSENHQIYKCSVVNPRTYNKNFVNDIKSRISRTEINFERVMNEAIFRNKNSYYNYPPKGTIFVDGISLSEIVS